MTVFGLDGIPPYTSHGHASGSTIPAGTPVPTNIARCGGPRLCKQCKRESGLEHEHSAADCAERDEKATPDLRCYVCNPGHDPAPCDRAPGGYQCTRGWHPAGTPCEPIRVLRDLNLFSISLVSHPPVNGCVELSEDQPYCPRCGAGYVMIGNLTSVAAAPEIRVGVDPTAEPVPVADGPTKDAHSRACGITEHKHGTACARDCPTCLGVNPDSLPPDDDLALDVPMILLQSLDSWLSALKHGRVLPRAFATMSADDRMELDTLLRRIGAWTRARG
jgi:hypothetical protein